MNRSLIQQFMCQFAALTLLTAFSAITTSLVHAAPRQSAGVEEGKCEVVSVGNYYCKVNGKCYYCTKDTNPDPNKDCYKETTCDSVRSDPRRPKAPMVPKGSVQPPLTR